MCFLYSTPQYWPSLDLYGWGEIGRQLRELTREGRWAEMKGAVTDEMLAQLVPMAVHGEIADVIRDWYGGLAETITMRMPADPADDGAIGRVIASLAK